MSIMWLHCINDVRSSDQASLFCCTALTSEILGLTWARTGISVWGFHNLHHFQFYQGRQKTLYIPNLYENVFCFTVACFIIGKTLLILSNLNLWYFQILLYGCKYSQVRLCTETLNWRPSVWSIILVPRRENNLSHVGMF